jgi:DNA invertase Pin-like site-specific DNA recombinase
MYFLYRHYSKDGDLLYVGLSSNVISRHKRHRAGAKTQSPWFDDVYKVTFDILETDKQKALEVERDAIHQEKPMMNKYKKDKVPKYLLKADDSYRKKINDRKEKVRDLYLAGMTWQEIANLYGITRQRAHQLGTSFGQLPQQKKAKAEVRKKKARELYAAGHTWVEIGRLFGVTPQRAQQLGK